MVHSYCLAIKIIQANKICCHACNDYYRFHLESKNISFFSNFIQYIVLIISCIGIGMSFSFLDAYLKCHQSGIDGARTFTSKEILTSFDSSIKHFIMDCVDYGGLLRIQGIIVFILFWSLYYSLNSKRNTKMAITILDREDELTVSRQKAKANLHLVREKNARSKITIALFDKIEYDQRAKVFN